MTGGRDRHLGDRADRALRFQASPLVGPPNETLANEHRHTFSDLNASYRTELG